MKMTIFVIISLMLYCLSFGNIASIAKNAGGEYSYYANTNRLKSVADGMGGTGDNRNMGDVADFVYDSEGNLTEDKSKQMKIAYDWRGMPVEFRMESKSHTTVPAGDYAAKISPFL